ncbi:EF-hand domain-containing protein [Asticcacaulis sp. BYS171W]|uniref:EF-hand domain-containing protein n=1 Tax=Asticcacaulis aquaticus TaxID=2984212 RepID=A0ABT5HXB9_9CAUL|nr:EF-hand domain-containing protein [Asticcacaulis aquaticus]MDC7684722.1 EF-hand domain-containing protein [Asticcacaulis aquaticus]
MLKRLFMAAAAVAVPVLAVPVFVLPAVAQPAPPKPDRLPHPPAFEDIDTNKDGKLTPDEFKAFADTHCGPPKIDANADGKVSLDEFLAPAKAHFAEIDANKNGFIDGDEKPARGEGMRGRQGGKGPGGKGSGGEHRGPPPGACGPK